MNELEKLQRLRELIWGLAWSCGTDWMVLELQRLEDLV